MRSMPSLYSASADSGITTSSLILNALVWAAIAAVRERAAQNRSLASRLAAINPSPSRWLMIRTIDAAAAATASSESLTISASNSIRGNCPRDAFGLYPTAFI